MIHGLDPWSWKVMPHWAKGGRHRSLEKLQFKVSSYLSTFQDFVEIILKEQKGIWPGHMEIAIKIYSVYEELGKPSLTA